MYAPAGPDLRATVYGPAVGGTVRVDDPFVIATLAALPAPSMPRPVIAAAPPPRSPRLAIIGAVLAVLAPPLGLVVSAVALTRILEARPRLRGEALAVLGVAASVIGLCAAVAIAAS